MSAPTPLQFAPFSSNLHPAFWTTFAKHKLEVLGLNSDAVDVKVFPGKKIFLKNNLGHLILCLLFQGTYVNDDVQGLPAGLTLDWSAFHPASVENKTKLGWNEFYAPGHVLNKNTLEEFKQCDKKVREKKTQKIACIFY